MAHFSSPKNILQIKNETEQERTAKLTRRRVTLRLLGELFLVGIVTDYELLLKILQDMIAIDQNASIKEVAPFQNLTLIVSFLRTAGREILALKPRQSRHPEENEEGEEGETKKEEQDHESYLTPEQKKAFLGLEDLLLHLALIFFV